MRSRRLRRAAGPRYVYTNQPPSPRAPGSTKPTGRHPKPPPRAPNRRRHLALAGKAVGALLLGTVHLLTRALLTPVRLVAGLVSSAAARARPTPAASWEQATEAPPRSSNPGRAERRARKELARRDAEAVLTGAPLPGEEPPPRRRGRRGARAPRPNLLSFFETQTQAQALGGPRSTMPVSETLRSALEAVAKNGLRSALTMLGIVIGVASVIALVAMGNGMRTNFDAQFSRLANLITITSTNTGGPIYGKGKDLTERDIKAISDPRRTPDIVSVSPSLSDNVIMTLGQAQSRTKMIGVQANYLELMDRKVVAGQWFNESNMSGNERVAVLGEDPVTLLWGRGARAEDVIGSKVRVKNTEFKVIGILKSDGQNDNVVIAPFGAARTYLVGGNDTSKIDQIVVRASNVAALDRASSQIVTVLDDTHNIRDPGKRDYNVLTYTNLLNKTAQFIKNLTLFIVAIAAISLLVGGIGVANIMLVSVTERTREIGIRKAIGAKNRFILRQFLSEAVMLTGLGGIVGVVLGIGATLIAERLLPPAGSTEATETNFPAPILTAQPVVVAFAVSLVIGVLAGMYPAHRATRMRPVDALRFE
uniref:ABC transporter permease n=1 Tax=Pseudonocardia sp. CA-138482 TaxID=3240023 RepID=UPI003F493103